MGDRVRIANASGYWGDDPEALARQVRSGTVDYVLHHALGGGGTVSLGADHQGKTLAQGLLTLALDVPEAVLAATPSDGGG